MIRDDDLVEVELFIEELKDTKPEGECATQLCDMLNRAWAELNPKAVDRWVKRDGAQVRQILLQIAAITLYGAELTRTER